MIKLPSVTLVCVDCVDPVGASRVLAHCANKCDFGDVKLITDADVGFEKTIKIKPLKSLVEYSLWMLKELYKHIDTEHLLIVQRDGWILNPDSFDYEWLKLDYVSPLFIQYDHVGSGGFSLRSRKIMEYASTLIPDYTENDIDYVQNLIGFYEDGFLSFDPRFSKFAKASIEQGAMFGQGGNRNPKYFRERPFGFHRTWQEIDFSTGRVDSTDTTKDLNASYNLDDCGL